jgi:hypothetical protein
LCVTVLHLCVQSTRRSSTVGWQISVSQNKLLLQIIWQSQPEVSWAAIYFGFPIITLCSCSSIVFRNAYGFRSCFKRAEHGDAGRLLPGDVVLRRRRFTCRALLCDNATTGPRRPSGSRPGFHGLFRSLGKSSKCNEPLLPFTGQFIPLHTDQNHTG